MGGKRSATLVIPFSFSLLFAVGATDSPSRPLASGGLVALSGRVVLADGLIRFLGEAPAGEAIDMSADQYCREQHGSPVLARAIRVGPDGGLGDVLVRVRNAPAGSTPPADDALLDQAGCMYAPTVVAIRVGQTLVIRNSDATLHNVRVSPEANRGFNLGQPLEGIQSERSFQSPEIGIPVRCDIHGWMSATIHVLDHSFFALSAEDGSFTLPPLPAGEYEIEAWHPELGTSTQHVSVSAGPSPDLRFEFSVPG